MIKAEAEGLEAYASFVCSLVATGRPKPSFSSSKPMYFAALLTPLFEHIALIISQHQPVVEKYYGQSKMLPVAVKLTQECDRQGMGVLSQWSEERRMNKKLVEAKSYRFTLLNALLASTADQAAGSGILTPQTNALHPSASQQTLASAASQLNMRALNASLRQVAASQPALMSLSSSQGPSGSQNQQQTSIEEPAVEVKEIDSVLQEIAQISGRWQLFRRFLYDRLSVGDLFHPGTATSNLI